MFWPLGVHLLAFKVHKIKITVAESFCIGRLRSHSLDVTVSHSLDVTVCMSV
jgi:hypothetical protein